MTGSENIIPMPDLKAIDEVAALWVMQLDEGNLAADQQVALTEWLAESELHVAAFDRLADLWGVLDAAVVLSDHKAANDRADSYRTVRSSSWLIAVAASILAVAVGTLILLDTNEWQDLPDIALAETQPTTTYSTAVGEQKTIELSDGSRVTLNTNSRLEVTYSDSFRTLTLKNGEAHFQVAKNKNRPFSVKTSHGQVTAIGTTFTVRVLQHAIDVVVSEGLVSLDHPEDRAATERGIDLTLPVMVATGQAIVFNGKTNVVEDIPSHVIDSKLLWRSGMLRFTGQPLEEVLQDINRYTHLEIEIEDRELAELPISGRLRIGDVDGMLEALQILTNAEIQRVTPTRVVLTKAG